MQKVFRIKNKKGLTEGTVRSVLTYPLSPKKSDFVQSLIKDIPNLKDIGYAGFSNKKYLKESLQYNTIDEKGAVSLFKIPTDEVLRVIEKSITLSRKHI